MKRRDKKSSHDKLRRAKRGQREARARAAAKITSTADNLERENLLLALRVVSALAQSVGMQATAERGAELDEDEFEGLLADAVGRVERGEEPGRAFTGAVADLLGHEPSEPMEVRALGANKEWDADLVMEMADLITAYAADNGPPRMRTFDEWVALLPPPREAAAAVLESLLLHDGAACAVRCGHLMVSLPDLEGDDVCRTAFVLKEGAARARHAGVAGAAGEGGGGARSTG